MEIKKVIKKVPIQKVDFEEREVNVYVTKDGMEFSSLIMASAHEKNLMREEERKYYDNIEKEYFDLDIPNYQSFAILKVKNAEEAKLVFNMKEHVGGRQFIDIDSMKFPNMFIISSYLDKCGDYQYDFEKIGNLILECQPFVDFYNRMLDIKKEYELGDNQYE